MGRAALFQWDYHAFPVWSGGELPSDLSSELQTWSDEGTERYFDRLTGVALPDGWEIEWSTRGRALARRVAAHVGSVDYKNESTGLVERIESN